MLHMILLNILDYKVTLQLLLLFLTMVLGVLKAHSTNFLVVYDIREPNCFEHRNQKKLTVKIVVVFVHQYLNTINTYFFNV